MVEVITEMFRTAVLKQFQGQLNTDDLLMVSNLEGGQVAALLSFPVHQQTIVLLREIYTRCDNVHGYAFSNLPREMHNRENFDNILKILGIRDVHVMVWKSIPYVQDRLELLCSISQVDIQSYHAFAFENLPPKQHNFFNLQELAKLKLPKEQETMYLALSESDQTFDNLIYLTKTKFSENQIHIFNSLPENLKKIDFVKELAILPVTTNHAITFYEIVNARRSAVNIDMLKSLVQFKISDETLNNFINLPDKSKTISGLKVVAPGMFNGFLAISKEAMVTTIIRRDLVPFFEGNYKINDKTSLYNYAPLVSKMIVMTFPDEVITSVSAYTLHSGIPQDTTSWLKLGCLLTINSVLASFPKVDIGVKVGTILVSLIFAEELGSESKASHNILSDIKDYALDPISIGSLSYSAAFYGLGFTTFGSFGVGIVAGIAAYGAYKMYDAYDSNYIIEENMSSNIHGEILGNVTL